MPTISPSGGAFPVDIDHRSMRPPFLRKVRPLGPTGDITLWDFRIGQPNVTHLELDVVHSLEHCLNAWFAGNVPDTVYQVAPLGCQTGFYLVCSAAPYAEIVEALVGALKGCIELDGVPMANELDCGWARMHSLQGAKSAAAFVLSRVDELAEVD